MRHDDATRRPHPDPESGPESDPDPATATATDPAVDPAAAPRPDADPAPGVPVVVTGLMGAGKTTVATALAARWNRPLRDSDADLLSATGRSAAYLATERGPDALHALEVAHAIDAVAQRPAPVVAAAAFVVEDDRCRAMLGEHAIVVWLDARPEILVARQLVGGHRPRYGPDLLEMLRDMDRLRRPLFESLADVAIRLPQSDPTAPAEVRDRAVAALVVEIRQRVADAAAGRAAR